MSAEDKLRKQLERIKQVLRELTEEVQKHSKLRTIPLLDTEAYHNARRVLEQRNG